MGRDVIDVEVLKSEVDERGFAVARGAASHDACDRIIEMTAGVQGANTGKRRGGVRDVFSQVDGLEEVVFGEAAGLEVVSMIIGLPCFAVRSILFDKTVDANWKVTWHQDVTVAVVKTQGWPSPGLSCEEEALGFGPWSVKDGVDHVRAPARVLEHMLTARVHLDDCGEANGPLRVLPGSHREGVLEADAIAKYRERDAEVICTARRGDVVLMRPLLLHASSLATAPVHRRVLHIEFAGCELPEGLAWYERRG